MGGMLISRSSFGKVVAIETPPTWPDGYEPDLITPIRRGFIDGHGWCYAVPASLLGYVVYAARDEQGWYFAANPIEPLTLPL